MNDTSNGSGDTDLDITVERDGERAVIAVRGELDAYGAPNVEQIGSELLTDGITTFVVDMAGTTFLDSSGLRAILTLRKRVEHGRGRFSLRAPSDAVTRLLDITGLTDYFGIGAEHSA